jgi:hypothetical protein
MKFHSSGTKQWTKQLGTSTWDFGNGVTTDSSGNIYVTGETKGGLDGNTNSRGGLVGGECVGYRNKKRSCYDIFLVKYNSSGTKQWTKQLGTSSDEQGNGVTTDSSGNIYVTGGTEGGLDGNTNMGGECEDGYDKRPCNDIFLVKYNSSGTKQWTKQLGTSSDEQGNGVTTDSSGNIYVTGGRDIFLVKYNSSGIRQ